MLISKRPRLQCEVAQQPISQASFVGERRESNSVYAQAEMALESGKILR